MAEPVALGRCVGSRQIRRGGCGYVSKFKHGPNNYDYENDSDEDHPLFFPIWSGYYRQIEQSNGFDVYHYPGMSTLAGIVPYPEFNEKVELLTELANRAIQEYNEKECNIFEYKLLKIEKVNKQLTGYQEYQKIMSAIRDVKLC